MKRCFLIVLMVCVIAPVYATYYEITTNIYTPGLTLQTGDSLYMTDGGFGDLNLYGSSIATIGGTSSLIEGTGGVWQISLATSSRLYMSGGQVHEIDFNNNATAELHGGLIQGIFNYQATEYWDKDNQVWVQTPHINLYYSGDLPTQQTINGLNHLVGTWGSGDNFRIYLPDTGTGYDPYDNFEFILIPEPATLFLLGLGGLLIRRKR